MKASKLVLFPALLLAASALAQDKVELNTITAVRVSGGSIEIVGNKKPNFTTFTMTDPPRLVIDISEAVFSGVEEEQSIGNGVVTAIKTASYGSDASAIARVLVGFERDVETDIQSSGSKIVVKVTGGAGAVAEAPAGEQGGTATEQPAGTNIGAEPDREAVAAAEQRAAEERAAQEKAAGEAEERAQQERLAQQQAEKDAAARAEQERLAQQQAEKEAAAAAAREAQAARDAERKKQEEERMAAAKTEEERRAAQQAAEESARAEAARKKEEEKQARAQAAEEEKARREAEAQAAADEKKRKREEAQAAKEAAAEERRAAADAAKEEREAKRREAEEARIAARERTENEKRIAMAERQESATAESSGESISVSSRRKTMTFVGFAQQPNTSRISVRTDEPVRYSVKNVGEKTVVLELENTRIGQSNNSRFLDTSYFDTAVAMVDPNDGPSRTVRVEIKLKENVPYEAKQEGNEVYLEFQRPAKR